MGSSLALDQNFLMWLCETFSEKFLRSPKGSTFNFFDILQQTGFSNSKGFPLTIFGIVRIYKMNIFVLKIGFLSGPARYIRIVFLRPAFFLYDFSLICFYRSPPQFLLETKRFASIEDSLGFLALCDLPKTFIKQFFEILFFRNFSYFGRSVEQNGFFLCPVGKKVVCFRVLCVSLRVFFGTVKMMKYQQLCPFAYLKNSRSSVNQRDHSV